jgi:hypothetical protein
MTAAIPKKRTYRNIMPGYPLPFGDVSYDRWCLALFRDGRLILNRRTAFIVPPLTMSPRT